MKLQKALCAGIRSDLPLETVAAAWGTEWKGLQVDIGRQRTDTGDLGRADSMGDGEVVSPISDLSHLSSP